MTSEFQENYDKIKNKKSGEWEANFVGEDLPGRTAYYNEDIREENLRNEDVLLKSESHKQFLLQRFKINISRRINEFFKISLTIIFL